jgi:hypothetical protein
MRNVYIENLQNAPESAVISLEIDPGIEDLKNSAAFAAIENADALRSQLREFIDYVRTLTPSYLRILGAMLDQYAAGEERGRTQSASQQIGLSHGRVRQIWPQVKRLVNDRISAPLLRSPGALDMFRDMMHEALNEQGRAINADLDYRGEEYQDCIASTSKRGFKDFS